MTPGAGRLRDRVGPATHVLFVGINPGIRSAEIGHHFAGYSNRFWKLLYEAQLVPEPISCEQDGELPRWGFGLTNLVARATPGVGDLTAADFAAGRRRLVRKVARIRPAVVALVGVTVFRALFPRPRDRGKEGRKGKKGQRGEKGAPGASRPIRLGLQPETLSGARVFVLPNPSGRNANYSYTGMLSAFRTLARLLRHGGTGRASGASRASAAGGARRVRGARGTRRARKV
jgi:TDG/mug DNA glycosylase family protein